MGRVPVRMDIYGVGEILSNTLVRVIHVIVSIVGFLQPDCAKHNIAKLSYHFIAQHMEIMRFVREWIHFGEV